MLLFPVFVSHRIRALELSTGKKRSKKSEQLRRPASSFSFYLFIYLSPRSEKRRIEVKLAARRGGGSGEGGEAVGFCRVAKTRRMLISALIPGRDWPGRDVGSFALVRDYHATYTRSRSFFQIGRKNLFQQCGKNHSVFQMRVIKAGSTLVTYPHSSDRIRNP